MNYNNLVFLLFFCTLLAGCASPAQKIDKRAAKHGFERLELPGQALAHVSYRNLAINRVKRLHIYIEGDGAPWLTPTGVAADPTSHKVLMLDLMSLDSQASLYLGRPCYFGQAQSPSCHPLLWTHQRYSLHVVLSMVTALAEYIALVPYDELVFFGHSGGGTLAMLIAPYFDKTVAIVTLAANLDIDAWVKFHDYSRLDGSLNPAVMPSLAPHIRQIHYAGENDHVVPAWIIKKGLVKQTKSQFRTIKAADHSCCWKQIWRKLLNEIQHKSRK